MENTEENDKNDRNDNRRKGASLLELTGSLLSCCSEVMKELGPCFLDRAYKNALLMALRQKGLQVKVEQPDDEIYGGKVIAGLPVGLRVNFHPRILEWKRLQSNEEDFDTRNVVKS